MADISLDGKAAIVTGSGSGLGRVMALALAGAGANVLVADRRETAIDATMAAADANQRARLTACVADVGTEDGRAAIAAGRQNRFWEMHDLLYKDQTHDYLTTVQESKNQAKSHTIKIFVLLVSICPNEKYEKIKNIDF